MTEIALSASPSRTVSARSIRTGGLRIGLIGPLPPPAGGMAGQCEQLRDLLHADGLDVVFVQTNAPYRPRWIERVRAIRAFFRLVPYLAAVNRMCREVEVVHLLANSGWAWHLFAAPVVWISRMHGKGVIVNYRGGDAERFLATAPKWVCATLRSANACIVPSGFLKQVMERFDIHADVIPNVVDFSRFRAGEPGRCSAEKHIIVTRNLEAIYGIDDALRAFQKVASRISPVRLTIAGDGPERDVLRQLADSLGIGDRVHFAGRLSRDEMGKLYRSADVMLNPSTIDNMPNSVLESYASGVPVVSTNVGGIPFIARDGETALLVPPRDVDAMAQKLMAVMQDDALAQRLARNAHHEVQRYAWSEIGAQWMRLYETCAVARKRS